LTHSRQVAPSDELLVKVVDQFVSRGGIKLDAALTAFNIDVSDQRALDAGSSTGGFTDCLLQRCG
jgi:23S rRNA (cytidine1920-2'-O)/16S rRNA (cytidine1409-2'-O)-methyltransferase